MHEIMWFCLLFVQPGWLDKVDFHIPNENNAVITDRRNVAGDDCVKSEENGGQIKIKQEAPDKKDETKVKVRNDEAFLLYALSFGCKHNL